MTIAAMKQALEALEQINQLSIGENAIALPGEIDAAMDNLRAAIEQAEKQEPVAVWELFADGWDSIADPEWMESLPVGTKLYTAPPAAPRQWAGLTNEEIDDIWPTGNRFEFAREIEAKLKEKNT